MRVLVIVISFCILSCSSKKTVVEKSNSTQAVADSLVVTKVPNAVESSSPPSIPEPPNVSGPKNITEETKANKNDSLGFYQEVTKRTLTEHQLWNELLKIYVSEHGNVNYYALKKDHKKLLGYIKVLQITYEKINPKTNRPKEDLLAYWINAYNALTLDLILRNYPLKSIKDIKDPWDQRLWKFGDKWMNLNDIEHQILRKMDEPRIHFAIVCASESCPRLQNEAFTASKLEAQLTIATREFLSDTTKNEISETKINLSKIFKWFKKDFEQNGTLIDFLNQYTDINISNEVKKSYKDYNWDLND
ncbi:DUF547 domain-containing protein [Winogradskyella sp.]|uniref:DUF547 domain-containing protein n=1 Tax=Winogradskyella sp. TaxID=1883156 RepID=UPI003F6BBAAF